jgi:signal peptidase I
MKTVSLRNRAWQYCRKEVLPFLVCAAALFAVRSSLADWNDVPTGSMKPTIVEGDRVFVNKLAYDLKVPFTTWRLAEWGEPQRGDIVVFYSPHDETRLVKRVVGLPGDVIEMRNEQLLINETPVQYAALNPKAVGHLPETERRQSLFAAEALTPRTHALMVTPSRPAMRSFGPIRVPEGSFFMLGDNRDDSFDSRYFGPVERKRILGRANAVVLSVDKQNWWLPRSSRFFKALDPAQDS